MCFQHKHLLIEAAGLHSENVNEVSDPELNRITSPIETAERATERDMRNAVS